MKEALRKARRSAADLPTRAMELRSVVTASVLLATTNEPKHITAIPIKLILRTTRHSNTISKTKSPKTVAAHRPLRQ